MLATVIAQFTAKMTKWEKAIYFLSLMSCSINKLKSHMFFTCKNFMCSNFTWEKILLQEMVGEGGGGLVPPTSPLSLRSCNSILFHYTKVWILTEYYSNVWILAVRHFGGICFFIFVISHGKSTCEQVSILVFLYFVCGCNVRFEEIFLYSTMLNL